MILSEAKEQGEVQKEKEIRERGGEEGSGERRGIKGEVQLQCSAGLYHTLLRCLLYHTILHCTVLSCTVLYGIIVRTCGMWEIQARGSAGS
jgi:hypothetical protein